MDHCKSPIGNGNNWHIGIHTKTLGVISTRCMETHSSKKPRAMTIRKENSARAIRPSRVYSNEKALKMVIQIYTLYVFQHFFVFKLSFSLKHLGGEQD